jgi:translation initiation factor 2 subunit 1
MVRGKEFPSEGDLVVGTVREVQNFGAFVTLEEFPGKEGFLHIAEVSTGWVKRIRDHVREQQRLVVKVLQVDSGRGHIDLSLKRVNEHQRREKIQEWKNEQKAEKLLEIAATRLKKTTDQAWDEFGAKLADTYGALYAAFEAAASDEEALATEGFKGAWVKAVNEVARENIVVPFVTVKGYLDLVIPRPDGIKHIREALEAAAKSSDYEDVEISVTYLGAPLYLLKVRAPDYKVAEAQLEKASQAAIKVAKKRGGTAEFRKELKEVTH